MSEGRSRRYLIETWGCQMNQHDSEKMAGILVDLGYLPTLRPVASVRPFSKISGITPSPGWSTPARPQASSRSTDRSAISPTRGRNAELLEQFRVGIQEFALRFRIVVRRGKRRRLS